MFNYILTVRILDVAAAEHAKDVAIGMYCYDIVFLFDDFNHSSL